MIWLNVFATIEDVARFCVYEHGKIGGMELL